MMNGYIWNPKVKGSGLITCIPQRGGCPNGCSDCFFNSGRSYLEPLDKNTPQIPTAAMATGRIVRMNDGNDSNNERSFVEAVADSFTDKFFNTAIPDRLGEFPGPVVLTVNPGKITDTDFHKLDSIPENLMFVRVRVNAWNWKLVDHAVDFYTGTGWADRPVPVILTYMAYYTDEIPKEYKHKYEWKQRTTNSYWCLQQDEIRKIEFRHADNPLVYSCGYKGTYDCSRCGHCVREYHNTMERMRKEL